MNVPCGFANFAIDPLYSSLILNGADLGNADFVPGMIKKLLTQAPSKSPQQLTTLSQSTPLYTLCKTYFQ